jgi:hypothetical protein
MPDYLTPDATHAVPGLAAIGEGEASGTPGIIGDGVHFLSPTGQRRSQRGLSWDDGSVYW